MNQLDLGEVGEFDDLRKQLRSRQSVNLRRSGRRTWKVAVIIVWLATMAAAMANTKLG